MPNTFFITGVSSGLGRGFAQAALDAGHTVVGTVRKREQIAEFERLAPGRTHAVLLDITDYHRVPEVVAGIEEAVGPIDVLVNNAGYGVLGSFEETTLDYWREQFEVNVFGTVAVTQAVLPYLRDRGRGHIVFVSSIAGLIGRPTISAYDASKHAVEGLADSLRLEVEPFGIRVTTIEPGGFRTEWAGDALRKVERTIPAYDELVEPAKQYRADQHRAQRGDPYKAGLALLAIIDSDDPPAQLALGPDCLSMHQERRELADAQREQWQWLSESTDFTG